MAGLIAGAPAPDFRAECHVNPRFTFSSLGGRYVLLAFAPADPERRRVMDDILAARRPLFESGQVAPFFVLADRTEYARRTSTAALYHFLDEAGDVRRLYGAQDELWVLIDPMLRILAFAEAAGLDRLLRLLDNLPPLERHAGVELTAPVLVVPRILEVGLCRELIDYYRRHGGAPSGTMQEVDGRTVGVFSDFKKRRDQVIEDDDLRQRLVARLQHRLLPQIEKAFGFRATRIERYIVACYDARDGGYFRPHRDNTTPGTAHRQFAVSINLNAEEHEGGDLRFPEFGSRTYRAPTGGAVVFGCALLHEATPVTRGVRYATLPFLYDEAGAAIRQRNLHSLVPAEPAPTAA